MKRYWKLLILALFAFSLLGIHYVQGAREINDHLTLSIKTIDGDESIVQNRTFNGLYGESSLFTPATVTLEGYTTSIKGGLVYSIFGNYSETEMEPLIQKNRSFMRGKIYDPIYYYEDGERLLYVDIPALNRSQRSQQITFNVSLLTKEDGTEHNFTAKTQQSFPFYYVDVVEVQLVDGSIKVVVSTHEEDQNSVLYVFTIDATKRTVIDHKPLLATKAEGDYIYHNLYKDYSITPQTNFLYSALSEFEVISPEHYSVNRAGSEQNLNLYKMDLKTMENVQIDVPEAVRKDNSVATATNDATYFVVNSGNNLNVYSYYFYENEWEHVELENSLGLEVVEIFVVNNVLYFTYEDNSKNILNAYDVVTGKRLYRGEITSKSKTPFYFRITSVK